MVVQHNLTAMNSNRMLNVTTKKQAKATEKLSSGFKINRAADDAAGLAISEKMRKQMRGLTQASSNAQDGISMVQTADGALEEVHAMLQRCNELAIKAANGTLSDDDRNYIKAEIDQIHTEIDRVRTTSKFNETYLFPETGTVAGDGNGMVASDHFFAGISYDVARDSFAITTSSSAAASGAEVLGTDGKVHDATILEERIANEYVPNAIKQILDTFPSLKTSETIDIALDIAYDPEMSGENGTLAYASISVALRGPKGDVVSKDFKLWVDTMDFDDDDALGSGEKAGDLEATLLHEMMHTVMQNVFTDQFVKNAGTGDVFPDTPYDGPGIDFPKWFKEGMADVAGGGYSVGHNRNVKNAVTDNAGDDTATDAAILSHLKSTYSITNDKEIEVYGKGYLASAYIGYLVTDHAGAGDGSTPVTRDNILSGIDKLFNKMKGGTSFGDAVLALTGKSYTDIQGIADGNADTDKFVPFVRELTKMAGDGVGAFAAKSLTASGTDILGSGAGSSAYRIIGTYRQASGTSDTYKQAAGSLSLHVGADSSKDNKIEVNLFNISVFALGIADADFTSMEGATQAIDKYADAIQRVSSIRSYFGAIQNRLEHTIANLDNVVENTTAAESAIRDTDMATEMVRYSNNNILAQAGQAMLAQANQSNQGVLSLLG